jgi:DNA polymerase I-like protein with 3'-5' exonuclease and polymerase domains
MRLAAYLSADPVFMAACGADLHAGNAKNVFPEIAAKGWLDDKDALKDPARGKPFRDIAKNLGFAIAYGADAPTVHANLASKGFKVTLQIVEGILAKLQRAYRVYYAFVDRNVQLVQRTGFMRTPVLGRIRYFGHYPKATEISNFPVQSALADIVNSRMVAVRRSRYGRLVALVAQIHDACIYEVPEALVDEFKAYVAELWSEPVRLLGGPLVLPIDLKVGDRWSDF